MSGSKLRRGRKEEMEMEMDKRGCDQANTNFL